MRIFGANMRIWIALGMVLAGVGSARADGGELRVEAAPPQWIEIYPGVRYAFDGRGGAQQIHLIAVDLCAAGVSVRGTAPGEGAVTTSTFGERVGAQVAINGDYFREDLKPIGLAAGGGELWEGSFDGTFDGFVAFGPGASAISLPRRRVGMSPPEWMTEIVGGMPALVVDGEAVERFRPAFCNVLNPR